MKSNWSDYEVFMKPVHLKGQAVTLTITKATEEETHPQKGKTVKAPVLWFRELPFGLILSPTNRTTLIALYGDRVVDCLGKPIVVKAVKEQVAGRDKEPIRIQNVRPNAPRVEVGTGEIVEPVPSPVGEGGASALGEGLTDPAAAVNVAPASAGEVGQSELEKHFGPRSVQPLVEWPKTEAAFTEWLKARGINGLETRNALGTDAKTWLRKNPSLTWADVAMKIAEHQAKVGK